MTSARYESEAGTVVRVVGNNLLVRVLPSARTSRGGILIPDNVLSGVHALGEVLAVGFLTGSKLHEHVPIPGITQGDYVLFVKFHERTDSNQHISHVCGAPVIRIRPGDVLLVMDAEDIERLQ